MLQGPFRSMRHDHVFRSLPDGRTEMRDVFNFAAPIPVLGLVAEALVLRRLYAQSSAGAQRRH